MPSNRKKSRRDANDRESHWIDTLAYVRRHQLKRSAYHHVTRVANRIDQSRTSSFHHVYEKPGSDDRVLPASLSALFDLVFQITIASLDFASCLLNVSFLFQIPIAGCLACSFFRFAFFFFDAAFDLICVHDALL